MKREIAHFNKYTNQEEKMNDFFKKPSSDGTPITGVRGGITHNHEYGIGIGHIRDQRTGQLISTYNNFNREIDSMLPTWMKNNDRK